MLLQRTTIKTNPNTLFLRPGKRRKVGRQANLDFPQRFDPFSRQLSSPRTIFVSLLLSFLVLALPINALFTPANPRTRLSFDNVNSSSFVHPLSNCTNIRWDAEFTGPPGSPPRYVPVCADISKEEAELQRRHLLQPRQTSEPFTIQFTCTDTTDAICAKARTGFQQAGARLAKALKIQTSIVVQATFKSFCEGQGASCPLRNTLGQASASSYLQGNINGDGPWLFPQVSLFSARFHG